MKKGNWSICVAAAFAGLLFILGNGCEGDKESAPAVITAPAVYLSVQSVIIGAIVTDEGGAAITDRGICWDTSPGPDVSDSKISDATGLSQFTCTLVDLDPDTRYFVRAFATNNAGTGYGQELTFRTWNDELVTDFDGNEYHTVTIGSQVWLVENLKVTHYRNGDPIEMVSEDAAWERLTSGAYCNYNHSEANAGIYGRLYNWFAVNDDRIIAMEGWHVASDDEWNTLSAYLGGNSGAGNKLKEAGTLHWREPNADATNETGFSALPGGHRNYGGGFDYLNWGGGWWCSTDENGNDAVIRYMDYGAPDTWRYLEDKRYGRSVRCLKD